MISTIQRATAEHYGITLEDIMGRKSNASVSIPRTVAIYLCRQFAGTPDIAIAESFNRHEMCVRRALSYTTLRIETDEAFKREIDQLIAKLKIPKPEHSQPCAHIKSDVKDSRPAVHNGIHTIRRRRLCDQCGERFTTIEMPHDQVQELAGESYRIQKLGALLKEMLLQIEGHNRADIGEGCGG